MLPTLPFKLKVPGTDDFTGLSATSTRFRFHGLLRFTGAELHLEWSGTARVEKLGALTARTERLPLPHETLVVPVSGIRAIELHGGWWRPRLELSGNDLGVFNVVPGESRGRARLWITRQHRQLAAAVAAAIAKVQAGLE